MLDLTEKIKQLPEPHEFLRRIEILKEAQTLIHGSSVYDVTEFTHDGKSIRYGAYDDGSGNEFGIVLVPEGSLVWGYDHESAYNFFNDYDPLLPDPTFEGIPAELSYLLTIKELAWDFEYKTNENDPDRLFASVAFWRLTNDSEWNNSPTFIYDKSKYDDGGFKYFFKKINNFSYEDFAEREELEPEQIDKIKHLFI
jgi:hypothetical protein